MATKTQLSFGDHLREIRETAGMSRQRLADESGVPMRTIQDLEMQGDPNPKWNTVTALAAALGVSPAAFV